MSRGPIPEPTSTGWNVDLSLYRNEGDVTLYVNNTGLMWENAKDFGALLIFAGMAGDFRPLKRLRRSPSPPSFPEHRYYGVSQPFGDASQQILQYLTHEQALADYSAWVLDKHAPHPTSPPLTLRLSPCSRLAFLSPSCAWREPAGHFLRRKLRRHAFCVLPHEGESPVSPLQLVR